MANPDTFMAKQFIPSNDIIDMDVHGIDFILTPFDAERHVWPIKNLGVVGLKSWQALLFVGCH